MRLAFRGNKVVEAKSMESTLASHIRNKKFKKSKVGSKK